MSARTAAIADSREPGIACRREAQSPTADAGVDGERRLRGPTGRPSSGVLRPAGGAHGAAATALPQAAGALRPSQIALATSPSSRARCGHPPLARAAARSLQCKLAIGAVNDPLEHEADHVADQVMRMPDPAAGDAGSATGANPRLQRKCSACEGEQPGHQCAACERDEHKALQLKAAGSAAPVASAPPLVHEVLSSPGRPLDAGTRSFMETRFGRDFGHVRVHNDATAADSAAAVSALAYTVGSDVVFASGQYSPASANGRRLLAHEMAHVVQQEGVSAEPRLRRFVASETNKVAPTFADMLTQIKQLLDAATRNGELDWDFLVEISGGSSAGRALDAKLGSKDATIKSRLLVRYLFTCRCGLIDMRHFMQLLYISNFATAVSQSESRGNLAATGKGRTHELESESESRFAAEDTPSNALGAATNLWLPGLPSPDKVLDAITDTLTRCDPVGWSSLSAASKDQIVHFYGDQIHDPAAKKAGDMIPKNQNQTAVPDILPINECGSRERSLPFSLDSDDSERKTIGGKNFLGGPTAQTSAGDIRSFVDTQRPELLRLLPTSEKIRMLNRLLDGWVRDVDVEAFEKICASIRDIDERNVVIAAVRARADELNSDRQRHRVLNALYG